MKLRAALGVLAGLSVCSGAMAGGALSGVPVVNVRVDNDGRGIVTFGYPLGATPPACGSGGAYNNALGFNTTTAGGQAMLANLLTAKSTGALVWVVGTGACTTYSVAEDLAYVIAQ